MREQGQNPPLPLDDVKVVEVAARQAGPACGEFLAEWGALVIKIEHPSKGDSERAWSRPGLVNYLWVLSSRSKKSVAVDLSRASGRESVRRIISTADVFVSNYTTPQLRKLGLDYDSLRSINPKLIYAQITALGPRGPESGRPGYDLGIWARSGNMSFGREPGAPPARVPTGLADRSTALATVCGILLALRQREKSSVGQKVDTSLLGTLFWLGGLNAQAVLAQQEPWDDRPRAETRPLYNHYRTKEDAWITLTYAENQDRHWRQLCAALERPDLVKDKRFDTRDHRNTNKVDLIAELDRIFATRTVEEWRPLLDSHGLIWNKANTYHEVVVDPQIVANNYVVRSMDPSVADLLLVNNPICIAGAAPVNGSSPLLGQHTRQVLSTCGLTDEDIERLEQEGVTFQSPLDSSDG